MLKKLALIILLASSCLFGQYYFGKNKIQYTDYDWKRLQTEHFDIYFFGEEEQLARIIAHEAEKDWAYLAGKLRFVPRERIPVIVYSSPIIFQETNVIPWILPEGIGGFTEYFKGRVVLPFDGRYDDFRHTLRHELVHAFIMHKNIFTHDAHELFFLNFLPLWIEEGLAEFYSKRGSQEMEMVIRSGLLEGDLTSLARIDEVYGSFTMYKIGQHFITWLADEYGEWRIPLLVSDLTGFNYFEDLFEAIYGFPLLEAARRWEIYAKKKYYPMIAQGSLPQNAGRILTTNKDGFNLSPVPVFAEGDSIPILYFQSSRMGYPAIFKTQGKKTELIVKGGFDEKLEAMHLFRNRISISKSGAIALSVKVKGGDRLTLLNANNGKVIFQKGFKNITGISAPFIDSSGDRIVFSGINLAGNSDIYLFDIKNDSLYHITNDFYGDFEPFIINNDIYFSSERCADGNSGKTCLTRACLSAGTIEVLSYSGVSSQPSPTKKGTLLFSSRSESGIRNICEFIPDSQKVYRRTNILTGLFEPSEWRGDSIIATVYTKTSYQIIVVRGDTVFDSEPAHWEIWKKSWEPVELESEVASGKIGYDSRLKFDIAQGTISTNTSMESGGGIEGSFSDMLGDRQIYFMVYEQGQSLKDLLKNLNIAGIYYNMEKRPIWGVGAFHFYTEGYNRYDFGFSEETAGAIGTISYPFSRFFRTDATIYLMYSDKGYFAGISPRRRGYFGTMNLSLVRDNSYWGSTGPMEGFRGNATIGATYRFDTGEISSYTASTDLRYYLRLTRRCALASRIVGRTSGGPEPERFWMGGTWDFRGYPFFSFYGKNLLFSSTELRFPLLDQFRMRFPFLDADLRGIKGAVFADFGQAWEDSTLPFLGSFGTGLRMNLGGITVIRFDIAWKTDFHGNPTKPYYDIFFGWDF